MEKNNKEQIKFLLSKNFFFSALTENEVDEIIPHCILENKSAAETIVTQGEATNYFYLIQEGVTEVWVTLDEKRELRATLRAGDTIGLIQSDSQQKRIASATVISATPIELIKMEDAKIFALAQSNPEFKNRITQYSQQIIAANLLKRTFPFKQVLPEDVLACAKKMQIQNFQAGEIIFQQGESGDCVYFIAEGEVEIFVTSNGIERKLVNLHVDSIFGEIAALTAEPRNASARALTPITLLALHRNDLLECIEKEKSSVHSFKNFIYHRSRPKQIESIEIKHRTNAAGEKISILKNTEKAKYYQLSEQGWFIWELLDGHHTINDINLHVLQKFQIFSPQLVEGTIENLFDAGFVSASRWQTQETYQLTWWMKILVWIKKSMELEFTLKKVDHYFSKMYSNIGAFIFNKFTYFLLTTIIVLGMIAFVVTTSSSISVIKQTPHNYLFLIALFPLQLLTLFFHESAHALTTKAADRKVNAAGAGFYWFMPIFFVDTSDMWLATPNQRIGVSAAGSISDLTLAGIATLIAWFLSPHSIVAALLWLFACLNYFNVLRNLDPLFEMDGYYILIHAFDRPNLRQDALRFLMTHNDTKKNKRPEIYYWLICLFMFIVTIIITILFQNHVLAVLFPGIFSGKYGISSFILPTMVVLVFFLTIWVEGRQLVRK